MTQVDSSSTTNLNCGRQGCGIWWSSEPYVWHALLWVVAQAVAQSRACACQCGNVNVMAATATTAAAARPCSP
jgi:hypothetical protein